jgi:hypothetical protein
MTDEPAGAPLPSGVALLERTITYGEAVWGDARISQ